MKIIENAYAKINWSLKVEGLREDGYHMLDMLMQSLELHDELSLESARWLTLSIEGQKLPTGEKNLVIRAANALMEAAGQRFGARINLSKNIPVRAGLGGGSADCAAALIGLNKLWKLHFSIERLLEIGSRLGADVPFCILGGLARAQGVGEILTPMPGGAPIPLALVRVGNGLSTPPVFARYDSAPREAVPVNNPMLAQAIQQGDIVAANAYSGNALEAPAIELMPEIAAVMEQMRRLGAQLVRMTGSGSTVFGAFHSEQAARTAAASLPGGIFTFTRS